MNTSYQGKIDQDQLQKELTTALGTSQGWTLYGTDAKAPDGSWEKSVKFITTEIGEAFDMAVVDATISAHIAAGQDRVFSKVKADRSAVLNMSCQSQIYAGFQSSALGTPHTYPAKDKDQSNLTASVVASTLPNLPADWTTPFWCCDANGVWALVPHTAAQIQQVGLDGKAAITTAIVKNATLQKQVQDATTVADVEAVTW